MNYLSLRGQSPGPLFLLSSGQPLSRTLLTHWLKDIFAAAGIQGPFSSHSFRIGAATVAARMGVPDHLIQAVGRWNSDAYKLYIRTPAEALVEVTSLLSLTLRVGKRSVMLVCLLLNTFVLGCWVLVLGVFLGTVGPMDPWPQSLLSPSTCLLGGYLGRWAVARLPW